LAVAGVRKTFPGAPHPVLDGIDMAVDRGALVHVGGDNGAGKTTLLRLVAGLLEPDAGSIRVDGSDPAVDRRGYQRRLGYVSAGNAGLYARLTVDQHLSVWGRMALVPADELGRRTADVVAAFGLGALTRRRVDRLSMGQRQRLRLALALLPPTTLLLLDEPDTSLDGPGKEMLAAAVEARLTAGTGVVWCSPDLDTRLEPAAQLVLRTVAAVAA
jgi:ABC-2 type transport system ATP-binding protein